MGLWNKSQPLAMYDWTLVSACSCFFNINFTSVGNGELLGSESLFISFFWEGQICLSFRSFVTTMAVTMAMALDNGKADWTGTRIGIFDQATCNTWSG